MTWFDLTSILFACVTIVLVLRQSREVKTLLSDARYERLEINRRLEKLGRRLDRLDADLDRD